MYIVCTSAEGKSLCQSIIINASLINALYLIFFISVSVSADMKCILILVLADMLFFHIETAL